MTDGLLAGAIEAKTNRFGGDVWRWIEQVEFRHGAGEEAVGGRKPLASLTGRRDDS